MPQVLDYSAGFPGAANIKRAGYIGAVRYIGTPGNIKCATAAELRDFTAHGLGMALVFEQYATDWRGGWQAGHDNYRRARAHADQIGFPLDRPIYMAVDQDVVSPAEFQAALDYIRGARDAAGGKPDLVGVYGEYDVCNAVAGYRGPQGERLCSWFWQPRAWSGTPPRLFPGRHLYQNAGYVTVDGIQCDYNDVLQPDWGQHLEDSMSSADAYNGFATLLKDAAAGAAPDLRDALRRILWDAPLEDWTSKSNPKYSAPASAWTVGGSLRGDAANNRLDQLATKIGQLGEQVARLETSGVPAGDVDYSRLAAVLADELDKRARDHNPDTGPTS